MTYHAVDAGGIDIAFEVLGEGRPILLIHGFGANRNITWRNTGWFDTLTRAGFQVIAMDCRGHGQSGKPHAVEAYDEGQMASDAVAVLSEIGIGSADVMGYSMGAMLAIRMMHDHPSRVRHCVLGGIGANYFISTPEINETIATALESDSADGITLPMAREFRAFCERAGDDLKAMAACMRRLRRIFKPGELRNLTQPVLSVGGAEDHQAGSLEPLANAFAFGESLTIPGRNHHSTVGDRNFKDATVRFLTGFHEASTD